MQQENNDFVGRKELKIGKKIFFHEKKISLLGIGGVLPPKRDLTRFAKWPKNVQIQRNKRILKQRLKVPQL